MELKHWKSASRKMSVLGWSFAPIETLVDASSPPDDPTPRAGLPFDFPPVFAFRAYTLVFSAMYIPGCKRSACLGAWELQPRATDAIFLSPHLLGAHVCMSALLFLCATLFWPPQLEYC